MVAGMRLSLDTSDSSYVIRSYDTGQIIVNDETITSSVIVTPQRLIRDWPPQRFVDLCLEDMQRLTELDAELILLATGRRLQFPNSEWIAAVTRQSIGLEVMDTAGACRTFNILSGEGRQVAAALMMI